MNLSQLTQNRIQNIIEYFIIIIPFFLISGPFIPDLLLSLTAIYSIFKIKNIYNEKTIKIFTKYFLVFFLIIIASSLQAEDKLLSLKNSFFYFRFFIFNLLLLYLRKKYFSFK